MTPRRTIAFALAVVLFPAGMAWGLEETWTTTKNGGGKWLYNVGAPGSAPTPATAVVRMSDVAPGACIPKSPGANTLPFICSVPETDYITPAYTFGGDLSGTPASANVIKLRETGGPTHLTIGAIPDGYVLLRSGSSIIGSATVPGSSVALATGAFGYGAAGVLTGDAANAHWDSTNFRAGFRTSAPAYQLHLVDQAGAVDRGLALGMHATAPTDATAPMVNVFRSRGTFAAPTTVTNTDYLGRLAWLAHDGTGYLQTAGVGAHVTNGATVATGSVPTDWFVRVSSTGNAAQLDPYAGAGNNLGLRVNSNNRVMVGINALTADPGYSLAVGGGMLVGGGGVANTATFGATGSQLLNQTQVLIMNNNASDGLVVRTSRFARSRGTNAAPTAVAAADTIAGASYWGYDGSAYTIGKTIRTFVNFDATVSSGSVPMDWGVYNSDGTGLPPLYVGASGDVVAGDWSQLLTSSTVGFFRVASTPGVPVGVPSVIRISAAPGATTTATPLTIDYVHGRLYMNTSGTSAWAPIGHDLTAAATGYVRSTTGTGVQTTTATVPYADITGAPAAITSLTTDVVAAGPGASAATIQSGVVTNAKLATMATARFKGRTTAGTGAPEDLTGTQATAMLDTFSSTLKGLVPPGGAAAGSFLKFDGTWAVPPGTGGTVTSVTATLPLTSTGGATPLIALQYDNVSLSLDGSNALIRSALTGDVTATAGSNATTIASNAVSNAKLRDSGALSVIGRNVNTTGDPADISASAGSDCVFRENGSTLACGQVATAGIADDAVTNAKGANMATQTFKGRTTAGTGDPEDLTATQATAMLNVFSSTLKGLAPASGGGTTTFLRADGTYAVPPGTGGGGTLTAVTASLPLTSSGGTAPNIALNYDAATITLNGSNQIQVAAQTGDVTKPAGSNVTTIAAQAVIYSKIQNLATDHLLGRDSAGAGSTEEIAVTNGIGFTGAGSIGLTTTGVGAVSCTNCSLTVGTDGRLTAASSGATPEVPLTFSTGITRSTNTITANISTGVSGGQTIIGGTASGNALTIRSNTSSNGKINIGNAGTSFFDEATGHLALGVASPDASATAQFTNNTNGIASVYVSNNSAGGSAFSGFVAGQSSSASGTTPTLAMYMGGSSNSNAFYGANTGVFELYGGSVTGGNGNMIFSIVESSGGYLWKTGLSPATKMSLSNAGVLAVNGLGGGVVWATSSTGAIAASPVSSGSFIVSGGTASAPTSGSSVRYDFTHDYLSIEDDATLAIYGLVGGTGSSNAEFGHFHWTGSGATAVFNVQAAHRGTGVARPLNLDGSEVRASTLTAGGYVATDVGAGTGELLNVTPTAEFNYFIEVFSGSTLPALNLADQYIATSSNTDIFGSTAVEYPVGKTVPSYYRVEACLVGANTITSGEVSIAVKVNGSGGIALQFTSATTGCLRASGTNFGGTASDKVGVQLAQGTGISGRNTAVMSGTLRLAIKARWSPLSTF